MKYGVRTPNINVAHKTPNDPTTARLLAWFKKEKKKGHLML